MSLAWQPDRPGNWLFHCHLMFHAVGDARLGPSDAHSAHSGDPNKHMAGLVLGIVAEPRPGEPTEVRRNPRRITLEARETEPRGRARRRLGFSMAQGQSHPGDTASVPGPLLVLTRGEPTDILVRNRLPEATAIHWHGIELESWSDGVPGWSGVGDRRAPAIAPGDSFVARLTLPRAGTFMYHTHLNDIEQITRGCG
jgi:FtsP/CotA-like multicopper oxidase with cupredoxin domain